MCAYINTCIYNLKPFSLPSLRDLSESVRFCRVLSWSIEVYLDPHMPTWVYHGQLRAKRIHIGLLQCAQAHTKVCST